MREQDMDEIRYRIDEAFRACIGKDWAAMGAGLMENWQGFTIRAQSILQGVQAHRVQMQAMLEQVALVDYEMIEIAYAFFDDVCLVPHVVRLRARCPGDDLVEIKLRFLDAFARQDGAWKKLASNVSLHPQMASDLEMVSLLLGGLGAA